MTVVNFYKLLEDNIDYKINDIKYAIRNNEPIEDKLNVIVSISNPSSYLKRYKLFKEFIRRFDEEEENVNIYVVELIYNGQEFVVTDSNNKNHLQLKTDTPLWHKENMINLGVKYLLPKDYKAFAWIDTDIEFENNYWALDTLKILNGTKDVVQLFSHCVDMNNDYTNLNLFNGFGYSFNKKKKYSNKNSDYWHPGYAWAITRKAYEKIGGIYEVGVLGSGDNIMALSFINKTEYNINQKYNVDYKNSIIEYQKKAKYLRLGYTPGVIRHHYHGSKKNRKYMERCQLLIKHNFSPKEHLTYDEKGIMIPSEKFNNEFKEDIMKYFRERKEDD